MAEKFDWFDNFPRLTEADRAALMRGAAELSRDATFQKELEEAERIEAGLAEKPMWRVICKCGDAFHTRHVVELNPNDYRLREPCPYCQSYRNWAVIAEL